MGSDHEWPRYWTFVKKKSRDIGLIFFLTKINVKIKVDFIVVLFVVVILSLFCVCLFLF